MNKKCPTCMGNLSPIESNSTTYKCDTCECTFWLEEVINPPKLVIPLELKPIINEFFGVIHNKVKKKFNL